MSKVNLGYNKKYFTEISRLQKQIELLNTNLIEKQCELQALEQSNRSLTSEIASNTEVQKTSINEFNIKIVELETSEKSLRDQVQYLTQQNDEIKSDLRLKDETKEQEYLNIKHIENELREEVAALKNEIKMREAAMAGNDSELQKMIEAKDTIIAEHKEAAIGSEQLHMMIVKQKGEEISQANASWQKSQKANESLSNENSILRQEIEKNASLIGALQKKVEESANLSTKFENDLGVNLKLIEENKQIIAQYESTMKTLELQVKEASARNIDLEGKVTELLTTNANMSDALEKDKSLECELQKQIQIFTEHLAEAEKIKSDLKEALVNRDKSIDEQQKLTNDLNGKLGEITENNNALQKELNDFRHNAENKDEAFVKLSAELKEATTKLNVKCLELQDSQKSFSLTVDESKVLSEQNSVLISEVEQLKTSLESSMDTVASLGVKITSLEDIHKSDVQTVDHLNNEINNLKSQVDNLNENLNVSQCALQSSKLENESLLNVTKELRHDIENLQKTISTKNEEFDKIQKLNADLIAKFETSVQNGNDVQEKLFKLEVEYGDLQRKMALLEQKCEQVRFF